MGEEDGEEVEAGECAKASSRGKLSANFFPSAGVQSSGLESEDEVSSMTTLDGVWVSECSSRAFMCTEGVRVSAGRKTGSKDICVKARGGISNDRVSDAEDVFSFLLWKRLQAPLRRASALSKALTTLTSGEMVAMVSYGPVMVVVVEEKAGRKEGQGEDMEM